MEPIPWYTFPILYGVGLLNIALAVPLIRRRIKPNGSYGVRFPSTLEDESVWYDINARGGRHLVWISVVYVAALTVSLVFGRTWNATVRFLVPTGLLVFALVCDAIVLGIASSRLLAQRRATRAP